MPSPFPGMDPYLEDPALWPDFHQRFLNCWSEFLADALPDSYEVRIDEAVTVSVLTEDELRIVRPDLAITSRSADPTWSGKSPGTAGGVAVEPVLVPQAIFDEVHEPRIHIMHRPDRELVTVIELLSPANKRGAGAVQYQAKRNTLLTQPVHMIELDLLVGGQRPRLLKEPPKSDYCALITRVPHHELCEYYGWNLADPLPQLPIPLRSGEPDCVSDLPAIFRLTYERGRYSRSVRYDLPPVAPLSAPLLKSAAQIVRGEPA